MECPDRLPPEWSDRRFMIMVTVQDPCSYRITGGAAVIGEPRFSGDALSTKIVDNCGISGF